MMRNIQTREGYEFWDKICKVQSYAFLLSPDGRRVVKTPDVGDWIDKHDAQVIVDHAQEEINVMKAERDALQQRLNAADQLLSEQRAALTRIHDRAHAFVENKCSMQVVSVEVIRDIAASAIGKDNSPPTDGQMSNQVEHRLEIHAKP